MYRGWRDECAGDMDMTLNGRNAGNAVLLLRIQIKLKPIVGPAPVSARPVRTISRHLVPVAAFTTTSKRLPPCANRVLPTNQRKRIVYWWGRFRLFYVENRLAE
jgi:hypothetical protein